MKIQLLNAILLIITGLEFLSFFAFLKVTFGTTIEIENLDLGYNGSTSMDCSNGEIRYECIHALVCMVTHYIIFIMFLIDKIKP